MIWTKIILLVALASVQVAARTLRDKPDKPGKPDKVDNGYVFVANADTGKKSGLEVKKLAIQKIAGKVDSPDDFVAEFENGFLVKGITPTEKKDLEEKLSALGQLIPNSVISFDLPDPDNVRKSGATKSNAQAVCGSGKKCCSRTVSKTDNGNLDWLSSGADGKYCAAATVATRMQVFVLDTGIDATHPDFKGRAFAAYDCKSTGTEPWTAFQDKHGHGTHTSGTVGSETYGVTPNANISHIKVLNDEGSGTIGSLLCGFDYVGKWLKADSKRKAILSMSLGFGSSVPTVDTVVKQLANTYQNQLVIVAAAGNDAEDACGQTLPEVDNLIAVGSVSNTLEESYFSNYGKCVDIMAPGENVRSTLPGKTDGTMSGTSMATPLVAGVIAQYWLDNPTKTALQLRSSIMSSSSPLFKAQVAYEYEGSPNKLVTYTCTAKC